MCKAREAIEKKRRFPFPCQIRFMLGLFFEYFSAMLAHVDTFLASSPVLDFKITKQIQKMVSRRARGPQEA